jgi:MFS transporter, NNP family, nitrate/nitrite transporter
LFLFLSLGYFVALIGSGYISSVILHRRTIVLSAWSVGAGLLMTAFSQQLWHLQFSIFFLGMGAGIYLPSGITSLTDMVGPKHWGKAVGIHELAPNLAFVGAPLIAEFFLGHYSWRFMPGTIGILALFIGFWFAWAGKGGDFPGTKPDAAAFRTLAASRSFWMMVILFGLAVSSTMGIYAMLPLYLIHEAGLERGFANNLLAYSRIPGLALALIAGWGSDYFGPARTIALMLAITGISTVLIGSSHHPVILSTMVVIQASFSTGFFPAGFALLATITPPEHRNVAISLTVPIAIVYGSGITPAFIGLTGETGSFSAGIMLMGVLVCIGAFLPVLPRKKPVF